MGCEEVGRTRNHVARRKSARFRYTAVELQESNRRVVHLLTAVKIPAGHQKLRPEQMTGCQNAWLYLLLQFLTLNWECMVQVEADQCFTLILWTLPHGMLLGALEDTEQITSSE